MAPSPRQTLTIPAFNEAVLLPRLLDSVAMARTRYAGGPAAIDVVVAVDLDAAPPVRGQRLHPPLLV